VPANSGAMPEAPPGAHTTQFVPVPVPVREPATDRPLPVVAAPLEAAALDARALRPPPPPPPELAAVPPPAPAPTAVAAAPAVEVDVAALVGLGTGFVADSRAFPAVPVAEGAIAGSATAPPPAG
jgi:hypothetical protein